MARAAFWTRPAHSARETEPSLAWLEKAVRAKDPSLAGVPFDDLLESLRSDPRWKGLLKEIGLPAS